MTNRSFHFIRLTILLISGSIGHAYCQDELKIPEWAEPRNDALQCYATSAVQLTTKTPSAISLSNLSKSPISHTQKCFIDKVTLAKKDPRNRTLLIDVRPKTSTGARINGALKIPLRDLKSKAFLKSRHILLVGDGYHFSELLKTCQTLKQKYRFRSVSVLKGGADAFLQDKSFQRQLISPRLFFQMAAERQWLILQLSQAELPVQADQNSAGNGITYYQNKQDLLAKIKIFEQTADKTKLTGILLSESDATTWKKAKDSTALPIYVLQGGMEAYAAHIRKTRIIQASRKKIGQRTAVCKG